MGSSLSNAFRGFLIWWGDELKAMLPAGSLNIVNRPSRRLVLSVEGERKRLLLERGSRSELLAESSEDGEAMDAFARMAKARPDLPIGLRFGHQDSFSRIVELPAQAEANFGRILDLDMERTTPFRSAEVLTAYHIVPEIDTPRGKRAVRHLILKRRTVDPLIEEMREAGVEPAFIDCWDGEGRSALPVNFLAGTRQESAAAAPLPQIAAILAVVLAISAIGILTVRNQQALDELASRTAEARREAAAVRETVEASEALGRQMAEMQSLLRTRPSVARILEELTAVMPDSAWVSDLRIDGDMVEFTGFAASAASIVPLLDASPLLTAADLTSSVVFDNEQNKERFTLRVKLRQTLGPEPNAAAPREGGSSL